MGLPLGLGEAVDLVVAGFAAAVLLAGCLVGVGLEVGALAGLGLVPVGLSCFGLSCFGLSCFGLSCFGLSCFGLSCRG